MSKFPLNKFLHIVYFAFFCFSCGKLDVDNTVAQELTKVSRAKTFASEDVRMFVKYQNLIYAACGSGGILVYREEGDNLQLDSALSLTDLYSQELDTIYVRSVEIVQLKGNNYLIFSYDTLFGGGIGVAEISRQITRIKGALKTIPGMRVRKTITTCASADCFNILAVNDGVGVVSYKLCFKTKKFRESSKIQEIVNYSKTMNYAPIRIFEVLRAPSDSLITSVSQITSIESLLTLAQQDPERFSAILASLPFLNEEQRGKIASMVQVVQTSEGNDVLNFVREQLGDSIVEKILQNPDMIQQFIGTKFDSKTINDLKDSLAKKDTFSLVKEQNLETPNFTEEHLDSLNLSLERLDSSGNSLVALTQGKEKIDLNKIHDKNDNPFARDRVVKDAALEIRTTVQSLGSRFFSTEDNTLKEKMQELTPDELDLFFGSVLNQAAQFPHVMSLLISTGVDVKKVYTLWKNKNYQSIIDQLEIELLAELFRTLPKYSEETDFISNGVRVSLPSIRQMEMDKHYLYLAAGLEGFCIAKRKTGKIVDAKKHVFSEVTSLIPYKIYGKRYYVMTDSLNGLVVHKRTFRNKIGAYFDRVSLAGESLYVYPYKDFLWVADGSNGVISVRFNKNGEMTIESEQYQKDGVAHFIGFARTKQVLVSCGSTGLLKLRVIKKKQTKNHLESREKKKDLVDITLEWGLTSPIAAFLKRIIFWD